MGKTIPESERLKVRGIRFAKAVWDRLTKEAAEKHSTPSDIVRQAVDEYYEKPGKNNLQKE